MLEKNIKPKSLTNKDIMKLSKPLKRDGDPPIPNTKEKILEWYKEQKDCSHSEHKVEEMEVPNPGEASDESDSGNKEEFFVEV